MYTFENICIQDKSLKPVDEAIKIIINPDSARDGLSEEMNSFLNLLQGKKVVQGLAGKTEAELLEEGIDKDTIEMAYAVI